MSLKKSIRQFDIILVIVLIAGLSASIGLFVGLKNNEYSNVAITAGWQYSWAENPVTQESGLRPEKLATQWQDITLPGTPPREKGSQTIWFRVPLPEVQWQDATLFFRSAQQTVKVYQEDVLIYSYGTLSSAGWDTPPGSIWNIIKLPPNYQGKTVYIELSSPYTQFLGYLGEVKIGSKSDLIIEVINRHLISIGLGSIFLFIGLACLVVYYCGKRFEDALLGLGFSAFFVGIWTIAESKLVQFFLYAPLGWMYTAFIAIYLAPVGYCIFYERFFSYRDSSIFRKLKIAFFFFAVCSFALDYGHLVSIFTTVKIFHILLVLSMFLSVMFSIQSAMLGNKEATIFSWGVVILCLTGMHDILTIFYPKYIFAQQRMTQWGMLIFVLVSASLIGARMKNLNAVLEANSRTNQMNYQGLFTNMIDACLYCKVIVDEQNSPCDFLIMEVNKTFENLWGVREGLLGRRIADIITSDHQKAMRLILEKLALHGDNVELESPLKVGRNWCKLSAFSPIPGYLCIIFKDITANKEAEDVIKYQAFHDSITGLHNRMYFEQKIQEIEKRGPKLISIISVDLDGLKIVNDTFGHFMGDKLLKEAARILVVDAESGASVARIGGDEFAIILTGVDNITAMKMVDKIIRNVENYNSEEPLIPISMSLGVATFDNKLDKTIYDVYKRADDNMYQYKMGQAKSAKSGIIDMLLAALAKKDYASEGHVERLANLAAEMAERLSLTAAETTKLVLLAKMHDLGKIGIPDEILFKPDKLTEEEYNKIKEHSKIGYSIANRISELSQIASLILHHHEYWDGNGYPDGLKGIEIPLECRILAIIDAYDAMTCIRPYSDGRTKDEAIQELLRCAGTQFDPVYTKAFLEVLNNSEGEKATY